MQMTVHLGEDSYPIYIRQNILEEAAARIREVWAGKRICIVTDEHVGPLYAGRLSSALQAAGFSSFVLTLPAGETTKRFDNLPVIYSAMLREKITRSDLLIALGGGVIGDLAGFAAATYLRGIPFVQIPTSLLAQVDSSVGGKVAVDLPEGKNLAGAFYQPRLVLIDPSVLSTLPQRYITDGMGEVIKYGCIMDAGLSDQLEKAASFAGLTPDLADVIYRCVDCKRQIVEVDPTDKKERMLLNFGHTLAHAIETYEHFSGMSHGEAVAAGMAMITHLSEARGLTRPGTFDRLKTLLHMYGLPDGTAIPMDQLLPLLARDKKNMDGALNLILLREMGDSFIFPSSAQFFLGEKEEATR